MILTDEASISLPTLSINQNQPTCIASIFHHFLPTSLAFSHFSSLTKAPIISFLACHSHSPANFSYSSSYSSSSCCNVLQYYYPFFSEVYGECHSILFIINLLLYLFSFSVNSSALPLKSLLLEAGRFLGIDSINFSWLMGPVRGLKKRKKPEKKHDENGSASELPAKEGPPLDWWIEFSKRINGRFRLTSDTFTVPNSLHIYISQLFFC